MPVIPSLGHRTEAACALAPLTATLGQSSFLWLAPFAYWIIPCLALRPDWLWRHWGWDPITFIYILGIKWSKKISYLLCAYGRGSNEGELVFRSGPIKKLFTPAKALNRLGGQKTKMGHWMLREVWRASWSCSSLQTDRKKLLQNNNQGMQTESQSFIVNYSFNKYLNASTRHCARH